MEIVIRGKDAFLEVLEIYGIKAFDILRKSREFVFFLKNRYDLDSIDDVITLFKNQEKPDMANLILIVATIYYIKKVPDLAVTEVSEEEIKELEEKFKDKTNDDIKAEAEMFIKEFLIKTNSK